MVLDEVIDKLKFLLFKSPVAKSKSGVDWKGLKMGDFKAAASDKPSSATQAKTPPPPILPTLQTPLISFKPLGGIPIKREKQHKYKKPEKWFSAGGVVVASKTDFTKVFIRKPSNGYGPWSFPKGRIDKGESPPNTALREVEEESGVKAALVPGGYLGTGEGDFSITHFYLMYCVANTHHTDHETEEVKLVSWSEAIHTFAHVGNLRDLRIASRALDLVEKLRKQGKVP